jgi:hypothetical protein
MLGVLGRTKILQTSYHIQLCSELQIGNLPDCSNFTGLNYLQIGTVMDEDDGSALIRCG